MLNGALIRFLQSLSYFGRKKLVKIKPPLKLLSEHQDKEKASVVEWLLEERTDIQEFKVSKDGNNYLLKAKNIG